MSSNETQYYTIYWRGGDRKVLATLPNEEIHECFSRHGYGDGAAKVIDFYDKGISTSHVYDKELKCWVKRLTMEVSAGACKQMSGAAIAKVLEKQNTLVAIFDNKDQLVIEKKLGDYALLGHVYHYVVFFAECVETEHFDEDSYMVTQLENYAIKNQTEAIAAFQERLHSSRPFMCSKRKSDSLDNIALLEEYKQLL